MRRYRLPVVSSLLMLALAGCALLPQSRISQGVDEAPTPTPIPTAIVPVQPRYTVQRGEVVDQAEFNARVSPTIEKELFFRTDGRVRAVNFRRNDLVKAGEIIAEFEIAPLERELASAKLDLSRAQSLLDTALRNHEYDLQTAQSNLEIARLELQKLQGAAQPDANAVAIQEERVLLAEIAADRLEIGIDPLLENDVERAKLLVEKLEAEIAESQIVAPFDGQILALGLTLGDDVQAFKPVATVADTGDLELTAELTSSQMEGLEEGMETTITAVRRPGTVLTGHIRQMPYPYGSGGSLSAKVEEQDTATHIAVNESLLEAGFELGDLVRATAVRERRDEVLWLPPQALRNFDGRRFVVVEEGDAQQRLDVTIGVDSPERVEIEEGLEEGQVVIGQ